MTKTRYIEVCDHRTPTQIGEMVSEKFDSNVCFYSLLDSITEELKTRFVSDLKEHLDEALNYNHPTMLSSEEILDGWLMPVLHKYLYLGAYPSLSFIGTLPVLTLEGVISEPELEKKAE